MDRGELQRLESGRWELLRVLNVAGHIGATETMMFHALVAQWVRTTREWVRNQLDYLESRDLIALERHDIRDWRAKLTRHGWDLTSYVVDCEPGIARPPKYWGDEER